MAATTRLTSTDPRPTLACMDSDDLPRRTDDPAAQLARQDLDPFSVAELEARIALLETEIVRCRRIIERAVNHRASADALFKR